MRAGAMSSATGISRWLALAAEAAWPLWLLLLVTVPVTSFPLIASGVSEGPVGPLALIPLAVLGPLSVLRWILRDRPLPVLGMPLLLFVLLAACSAAAAWALPLAPYKGQTLITRELRALGTLAIGVGFYLATVWIVDTPGRMRTSLRALGLTAVPMLAWASLQAYYVLDGVRAVPWQFRELHRLISVRDPLRDRVTALAYEPSWFGDQLVVLFLPLWLGILLSGASIFPRWRKIPVIELMLIGWGLILLFFTRSRISYVSLFAFLGALALVGVWRGAGWLASRLHSRMPTFRRLRLPWLKLALILGGAAGLLVLGWYAAQGIARADRRTQRLFILPSQLASIRDEYPYEVAYEVANRVAFAERLVYWTAAFRTFEQYPLLGVGPGNAGFLFEQNVPTYGHRLVEIQTALDRANPNFPNPKNLWIRLLAETGMLGFSAFLIWITLLAAGAGRLIRQQDSLARAIGWGGALALISIVIEGFSLDTFALPQLWLVAGFITAATAWACVEAVSPVPASEGTGRRLQVAERGVQL